MSSLERFETLLHDALAHLYDPAYRPSQEFCTALGVPQVESIESLRALIVAAIERLKPAPAVPPTARARRMHELLAYRYIQELTQKETARRLGITPRHLRREQQQAIHLLAEQLWTQRQEPAPELAQAEPPTVAATSWREQLQQELTLLHARAPGLIADVGAALADVAQLTDVLTAHHDFHLTVQAAPPGTMVALHPSVLQQVLITAVERVAERVAGGHVELRAYATAGGVHIEAKGGPVRAPGEPLPESEFIREAVIPHGGHCAVRREGDCLVYAITLQPVATIPVLVVDDNADVVHFYRRYTEGTRYQILHAQEGQRVLEMVEELHPRVIVLDVMLPDTDGWHLLIDLRRHATAKGIPVVVCSVVRRMELAKALGAVQYLTKPVRRQDFIHALDQALDGG